MFYIIVIFEKRIYIFIYINSINNIVNNWYENDIDSRVNMFWGRKVGWWIYFKIKKKIYNIVSCLKNKI